MIADDKPKTVTREYIYSGSTFKPKSINTRRKVKVAPSRLNVTEEMEESAVGMIAYGCIATALNVTGFVKTIHSCTSNSLTLTYMM